MREEILKYKRNKYFEYAEEETEKERMRANSKRRNENGLFKEWQQNNRDKVNSYSRQRWSNKKHNIPEKEWRRCKEYFDYRCAYCGMSEDKHKEIYKQQLHKEHVVHDGRDDIKNCIPSCKGCNSSKHTKTLNEWYDTNNHVYSRNRYLKIYQWLRYDCHSREDAK